MQVTDELPQLPSRLRKLPQRHGTPAILHIRTASRVLARLFGLAGLNSLPQHCGLYFPHTRSIHTFGMRFSLDLLWLDSRGRILRLDHNVAPHRLRTCWRATGVVELPAGSAQQAGLRTKTRFL